MDTQNRILQKADELFRRYGIRAVTLDEIANNLGISKKTIYQYFEDKDALVDVVMMAEFEYNYQNCLKSRDTSKDAVDEIFKMMETMDEHFKNLNPIILLDLKKFHFKTFEKFQNHMQQNLMQMIIANLKRGIAEGIYRENLNVEVLARFRMATVWLLFDVEVFPPAKFQLVDIFKEVLELFLYGLVNPKGYKQIEKYKQQKFK